MVVIFVISIFKLLSCLLSRDYSCVVTNFVFISASIRLKFCPLHEVENTWDVVLMITLLYHKATEGQRGIQSQRVYWKFFSFLFYVHVNFELNN